MPELSGSTYSETDASNNSASPNGMPEGMAPSGVNDSWRASMGATKRFHGRIQGMYASTGSANAYVLTYTSALAAYVTGERYSFRANFSNTGSATLNISGLGAKTIKKHSAGAKTTLSANDILSGQPVTVEYDGTDLLMVTPTANTFDSASALSLSTTGTGDVLTLTSTDAGAAAAPNEVLFRDSASPAVSDVLGRLRWDGRSSTAVQRTFADQTVTILDPVNATEDAAWTLKAMINGTLTGIITAGPGVQIGSPTGGDKGSGTLNATTLYQAGVSVKDKLVQRSVVSTATSSTSATNIPNDDTIPQNTEGAQILSSGSFTPLSASNIVRVTVLAWVGSTGVTAVIAALFKDSNANASAVGCNINSATVEPTPCPIVFEETGSASARSAT